MKKSEQGNLKRNSDLPPDVQARLVLEEERRITASGGSARPRRVLVVGGAGYVGTVLIPNLLKSGYAVTCADLLLYENAPLVMAWWEHPLFSFERFDLRDTKAYERILEEVTDVVLLAALVGDPITKRYPVASAAINVDATKAFIRTLRGRKLNKLIFVSTCSNYGLQPDGTPATETAELRPLSIYAQNKVTVEEFLLKEISDPEITILRFSTAFGLSPRMRFDLTVSEFTRDLFLRRDLLVYDSDTWRPYCHVSDLSTAIQRVLEFPLEDVRGQVFNTGADSNNHTKRSIVDIIRQRLPDAQVSYKEHGSDPRNYRVNFAKIRRILHFVPEYSVADGVDELVLALKSGVFHDADLRTNFYGNRQIPFLDAEARSQID